MRQPARHLLKRSLIDKIYGEPIGAVFGLEVNVAKPASKIKWIAEAVLFKRHVLILEQHVYIWLAYFLFKCCSAEYSSNNKYYIAFKVFI